MKTRTYSLLALASLLLASGMFNAVDAQEGGKGALPTTGGSYGEKTAFTISKIDAPAAKEFETAWHASNNGFARFEALVLMYKTPDGSIVVRSQGKTNERDSFSFGWTPDIIAVIHTHPNVDDPKPAVNDRRLADRFQVPVFTITVRGMFVYDPETRKTSMVQGGLDWLESSKWNR